MSELDWVTTLDADSFLGVYDVLIDIQKELNLAAPGKQIDIPLFQPIVTFTQIFPGDSIDMRDRYCELRWKATNVLKDHGVIREFLSLVRGIDGPTESEWLLILKRSLQLLRRWARNTIAEHQGKQTILHPPQEREVGPSLSDTDGRLHGKISGIFFAIGLNSTGSNLTQIRNGRMRSSGLRSQADLSLPGSFRARPLGSV